MFKKILVDNMQKKKVTKLHYSVAISDHKTNL